MEQSRRPQVDEQEVGLYFTATLTQRQALREEAAELGLSTRELLEQKVFGQIRPRQRKRRRDAQQDMLRLDVA